MTAADWIAEQRRVEQAATEGPWEAGTGDGDPHPHVWTSRSSACVAEIAYVVPNDYGDVRPDDAVFIAEARTSLPKMRAALEAVLALHWGEPCAQGPDYCAECEHLWPCGTYSAITEALGVEP